MNAMSEWAGRWLLLRQATIALWPEHRVSFTKKRRGGRDNQVSGVKIATRPGDSEANHVSDGKAP